MDNSTPTKLDHIIVRGARANNLKNVDVNIPKDKLTVITGLSGSGKSSLAFDTIYAEGQRRYVESLSAYARQFLGLMEKPDVDLIEGLAPAISIDQKSAGHNPRSTVGTVTEIYDYLRLLFARVGHPRSPETGKLLQKQSIQEIVDDILNFPTKFSQEKVKVQILAPLIKNRKGTYEELLQRLLTQGFVRVRVDGQIFSLEEDIKLDRYKKHNIDLVIDRLVIESSKKEDKEFLKRITDSIELAVNMGEGELLVNLVDEDKDEFYSENLVDPETGKSFPEIEPHSFSFNSPHGACERCSGLGIIKEIDPRSLYNPRLTIAEGAIYPWSRMADNPDSWRMGQMKALAKEENFDIRVPMKDLPEKAIEMIMYGVQGKKYEMQYTPQYSTKPKTYETEFEGVIPNLERRYSETDSENVRKDIEQYMNESQCPVCKGTRLRRESLAVTLAGRNVVDTTELPIEVLMNWVEALSKQEVFEIKEESRLQELFDFDKIVAKDDLPSNQELEIAKQVFKEINLRLKFLNSVGLSYLSLSRKANTLSGGESQRIRLASQIGTGLTGVLYVLDEPSIGLHQKDNDRLIETLKELKALGNTVLVVEHDEDTINTADFVVDVGPGAGEHGGEIIATGTPEEIKNNENSLTGKYLSGKKKIDRALIEQQVLEVGLVNTPDGQHSLQKNLHASGDFDSMPPEAAKAKRLSFSGITHHNLQNVEVEIPLGKFVCVTGVSGSGKSSLVNGVIYKALARRINGSKAKPGQYNRIRGDEQIDKLVNIDQSPIGRTPRSNPATYTGVFTEIRKIFAETSEAKSRGYKPGRFSFNVKGGRCENCQGDGLIKIEMQFLPDVYVTCDVCEGKRYNRETLQIDYKGKNIADVLEMTVEDATKFFENIPTISRKLDTVNDVGLGYIRLGQSSTTLSGGEAQRVKLASELSKRQTGQTLYILDEPTTGLHFDDVRKLLIVLHSLVAMGNTVLVIEHNLDLIKTADWIIDLGPEGGSGGGQIIALGTPEEVANQPGSYTGEWLKKVL